MQRILIIRLSAIGDVVFASPIIAALRRTYPQAHIAWLVEPGMADLVRHNPNLDEVIELPRPEWRKLWRERRLRELMQGVRGFIRGLRARRFDTAIDLQGLLKSGIWAWLSGARRRIGLGAREGSQVFMHETLPRGGDARQMSSEYRFLAEYLQLDLRDFRPVIAIDDATRAAVDGLLEREGLKRPYAVIAPFTTRPQKHWFEDAWRALIPRITKELDLPVVMLGGPAERKAAERIAEGLELHDLVGQTTLLQSAEIIRRAALLIGVDTGLTHMGTAFERPTVALFGSTCPYLATGSVRTRVIYHALDCSPCGRRPTCAGAFTCMRKITGEEVLAMAREALQEATL